MNLDRSDPAESQRDALLGGLLEQLIEGLRQGQMADVDALTATHPDLRDELRELWAAVLVAEGLARSSEREGLAAAPPATSDFPSPFGPPAGNVARPAPAAEIAGGPLPRLFGDYELLEVLGRGGMGVVYKARQLSLDRIVAVKMILRGELASPLELARFRAEAEATARLDHPHIVPIYEVGVCEGQPFFTMKFVDGTTLARELAAGPLDSRQAAQLMLPVCRAIAYAHERGVLHRDLKPSNILIDREGAPHITDFGLAKRVAVEESLTQTGMIVGTPGYMAPEQTTAGRAAVGPATDVYGLGAILYQSITGHPPFQAASPVDTLLMVIEQDPLPPRVLNNKVDRDLEMVALRCLQKPMDLRYPSATELAADLEAFLAGEPVSARSGGFGQVLSRLFRETHHAPVLENWGLLWMWHSLVLLVICVATNWFAWMGIERTLPYLLLWTVGLGTWASIFWALRRRGGPVTFVERQIAHVWMASVVCSTMLFALELILRLPVLTLAPVLGLFGGSVFLVKAGILNGTFYLQAAALFATALVMAALPRYAHLVFGLVSAACFFFPGLKYYRQRNRELGEITLLVQGQMSE